ncbi:MAG: hypothetical protein ACHQAQ_20240 [Hyphomicrobiales bacterium]
MAGDASSWGEGDRAKVVVSYSRKDVEAAEMLTGALATRGLRAISTGPTLRRESSGRSGSPA